jgi:hypothetical protein
VHANAPRRAALSWAEAVNALPQRDNTDAASPVAREHFSETEIAELCYTVATIKGWNLIKDTPAQRANKEYMGTLISAFGLAETTTLFVIASKVQ